MSLFLRLLGDEDKGAALLDAVRSVAAGEPDGRVFEVGPASFAQVPGAPFAYWVSEAVRSAFSCNSLFESDERVARQGGVNGNDFRWLRLWMEAPAAGSTQWSSVPMAKGGAFSPYYSDIYLVALWDPVRDTFFGFTGLPHRPSLQPASFPYYFRPGLTWPRRTQSGLALRAMPAGCIFADKGPAGMALT